MDSLLRQACIDACQRELDALPSEEELLDIHTFSSRFEKKMNDLIQNASHFNTDGNSEKHAMAETEYPDKLFSLPFGLHRKNRRTIQSGPQKRPSRRRLILLVILTAVLLAFCACAVIVNSYFTAQKHTTHSQIIFTDDAVSEDTDSFTVIEPPIPEGYEKVDESGLSDYYRALYKNDDGLYIDYSQHLPATSKGLVINTEFGITEEITLGHYSGLHFQNPGSEENLFWSDGHYAYILGGTCDYDTILKMAEAMMKEK